MSLLAHYTAKAKTMSKVSLKFSIKDVKQTLAMWPEKPMTDPYIQKLYAEYDAYTVELQRRPA